MRRQKPTQVLSKRTVEDPLREPLDDDGLTAEDREWRDMEGTFNVRQVKCDKWTSDASTFVRELFVCKRQRYKPKEVFDLMKNARLPNGRRRFGALSVDTQGNPNPLKSLEQIASRFSVLVEEKKVMAALGSADAAITLLTKLKCGCGEN